VRNLERQGNQHARARRAAQPGARQGVAAARCIIGATTTVRPRSSCSG